MNYVIKPGYFELEEQRKDREQRHYMASVDRQYQEKADLRRRPHDLFQGKRKAQRLEAEYTCAPVAMQKAQGTTAGGLMYFWHQSQ